MIFICEPFPRAHTALGRTRDRRETESSLHHKQHHPPRQAPGTEDRGARAPATVALLVGAQQGGPQVPLQLQEAPVKLLSSVVVEVHLEGNRKRWRGTT